MKTNTKTAICSSAVTGLVFLVIFAIFIYPNLSLNNAKNTNYDERFAQIRQCIEENALEEFDSELAFKNACTGYTFGLNDKYAHFFTKEEYDNYLFESQGNYSGLGLTAYNDIGKLKNGLLVWKITGNSPAEKAGIKAGDLIIEINSKNICDKTYDQAFKTLVADKDKPLNLKISRNGEILNFSLEMSTFEIREVDYSISDTNIGYIRIHEFSDSTYTQFEEAIKVLTEKGAKGFVFDVRNNPGGNLDTVCKMVDLLVAKGLEIATIEYKDEQEITYSEKEPITYLPSVVLINSNSASASELFASSLRDLSGAKLIGEQSYGKGVGQNSFVFKDGSAITLTTFKYYTRSHTDYNGIGLVPDIEIKMSEEDLKKFYTLTPEQDVQRMESVKTLKTLIG